MIGFTKDEDGNYFSGKHLLIDMWGCRKDLDSHFILSACEKAAIATGATVLFKHSHDFEPAGSSGVVILAESHVSYHYWQEEGHLAIDIFVCGDCDPLLGLQELITQFKPEKIVSKLQKRGITPPN